MRLISKSLILLLLIPAFAFSNDCTMGGKHTMEKKIERIFDVDKDATLLINNRYGNVDIISWNQNRIEVEVTIITNGNNQQEVQKRLDEIGVDFQANRSRVSAITTIGSQRSNWSFWGSSSNNVNMKINYQIKMPVSNSLDVTNHYGAISLNRLEGNAKISCNYGSFIIGELLGASNNIEFDYTKSASIGFVKNATIEADYSEYIIHKGENIIYKGNYSRAEFKEIVSSLDFNSAYGRIQVGMAKDVKGRSRYVTTSFGTISQSLELNSNYGKISVALLEKSIKRVAIDAKYTSIDLTYDSKAAFDLSTRLSYASLRTGDDIDFTVRNVQNTRSDYQGHYGRKNSGNTIQITSDYGGVKIQKQ